MWGSTETFRSVVVLKRLLTTVLVTYLLIFGNQTFAYKQKLHQNIAVSALRNSSINTDNSLLESYGISHKAFDSPYYPLLVGAPENLSITGLVRRGANDQDNGIRALNHFYDPYYDRALTSDDLGVTPVEKSPDWALEDIKSFYTQSNSMHDTYDFLYEGLTLPEKLDRDKKIALTFYSIGQVIHHIADMAQPQHVRNDSHCDSIFCVFGHESLYERYTENLDVTPYSKSYPVPIEKKARSYWHTENNAGLADYTNRGFFSIETLPEKTWWDTTSAGEASHSPEYPLPAVTVESVSALNIESLLISKNKPVPPGCSSQVTCYLFFFGNEVVDERDPGRSEFNPRAVSLSIYDEDLVRYHKILQTKKPDGTVASIEAIYSLNSFNFDSAIPLLIPRAISYSTGLINFVFRGRIAAINPKIVSNRLTLKVKNTIDKDKNPEWNTESLQLKASGTQNGNSQFLLTYEYTDTTGQKIYGNSTSVLNLAEPIAPGDTSTTTYEFVLPQEVLDDIPGTKFRLVYRGGLGQESDSVIAAPFRLTTGFLVRPNYAPADGLSKAGEPRLIFKANGQWKLSKALDVQAGNTDWKGWYVNNKPTQVLTWMTYGGRQIRTPKVGATDKIYRNGEVYAVAPLPVLGASLVKNTDETSKWLVAICMGQDADVVYAMELDSTSLETKGNWKEIAREPYGKNGIEMYEPLTAWFFRSDGTEAQAIRWIKKPFAPQRVKMSISVQGNTISANKSWENDSNKGFNTDTNTCDISYNESGGGGSWNYKTSGEWVYAVDYVGNSSTPTLGKILLESGDSANVSHSVSRDSDGNVISASSSGSSVDTYKESIQMGGVTIPYLSTSSTASWSQSYQQDIQITEDQEYHQKRWPYIIDLRYKLYAYGEEHYTRHTEAVGDTAQSTVNSYDEHKIESDLLSPQLVATQQVWNGSFPSKTGDIIQSPTGLSSCPNFQNFTNRYWDNIFEPLGSGAWLVDVDGNVLFSQGWETDYEGRSDAEYHYLTNGELLQIIPPGSSVEKAGYHPAGLVK